ncbi:alpha/beta hydrolase fold domain-containing protein [Pseudomonas sp. JAI111]|uniref:alpha/beta hydrolase fold domain-containing protein n=1 Tax=Pseudomonas sp. JAI111 TaxID=2735913 RepID=UPI0038620B18
MADYVECAVLMINYRQAPHHLFPAPIDDVEAALAWAAEQGGRVSGFKVSESNWPILLAGDGTGANTAAVVARRRRDSNTASGATQILLYPLTYADFQEK